jgi:type I restriction enzyme S subunit
LERCDWMAVAKLRFKADDGNDYPEWNDFTKLEDISAFITKGATPTTYGFDWQPNGVYFFRNDCIKNNVFVYGDYSFIAEEANKFLQRSEVTGGDIVIAITGDIGKVGLIPSEVKKANINQHLARVRIVKDAFPYFVYMYLCSDKVQRTYKKIKTGLSMPQLSLAQIRDTNILVVSLPEQQKIAEFLSTIDTVIEKQKETVSAWEERKKGVMQKLFSQEVRFKADDGSNFPEWEEKKLGEVGDIVTGNTPSTKQNDYYGECYLWVTPTDITDSREVTSTAKMLTELGYTVARHIPANSILVTCIASIGKNAILRENGSCNQQINSITPYDEYSVEFVYYLICQNEKLLHANAGTGGMEILNKENFSKIKMYFPCLAEQRKIADCFSSLDEVIEKQKATLAAWEELKKGLLQQMFC